jgi:hypothetical protein
MFLCGIALVFALVLESCSAPASDEYKGLGESLNLSGQAYTRDFSSANYSINYAEYANSLNVSDGGIGGTGKIENGKLSYSIKKPKLSPVAGSLTMLQGMYADLKFSPEDAQAALLNLTVTGGGYSLLSRETISVTIPSLVYETVYYVYVDKDTVVTAEAGSFISTDFIIPISITTQKINIKLKKGWNALHGKTEAGLKLTLSLEPEFAGDLKISVDNPSDFKWTLGSPQDLPF